MTTYLFAWNPNNWSWPELPELSQNVSMGEPFTRNWSCGNSKNISPGDNFYIIRLGLDPKGIFASGKVISSPFYSTHWDPAKKNKEILFVTLLFDTLLDPVSEEILTLETLKSPPLSDMYWTTQRSGIKIKEEIEKNLENLWAYITNTKSVFPEEIDPNINYHEGVVEQVLVNSYERNRIARKKCLDHYGTTCIVCGFNFYDHYGELGKNFIHVHHLIPISNIKSDYIIDPVKDLRPICPNCHSMLHRSKITLSIEELKEKIIKI